MQFRRSTRHAVGKSGALTSKLSLLTILISILALLATAGCSHRTTRVYVPPAPAATPQPSQTATPQQPSQQPASFAVAKPQASDAIGQLITKADAFYQDGMQQYQAGNLAHARTDFDQALGVLLGSKYDIEVHRRLDNEFEKLVQNTYSLEVASLNQGNVLSERPYAPPPIQSLRNLTFRVNPAIRARVRNEMKTVHSDIPLVSNDAVDAVISYLQTGGRDYMTKVLRRIGKYRPMISRILRQHGLPQDLIYLPAIESGFNPFAVSDARCVGLWQFALGTGRLYGLERTRWVDERSDPVMATEAAAAYLKSLYQEFGDWYLALAAYDTGDLNVQRAIERTGYANYWKLRSLHALLPETQNYVPIFLATAIIAKDPQAYGFDVQPDPPLTEDHVKIGATTDLRLVAEIIGSTPQELLQLNPSLLRWTTPADDPNFVLNLPKGTAQKFEQGIALIPRRDRIWWRVHTVAPGETLASIARADHLSESALARSNHVGHGDPLTAGEEVVLPFPPGHYWALSRWGGAGLRRPLWYRIRPGDSLGLIADRFNLTVYQIRRWNDLHSTRIIAGHLLRLYTPLRDPARGHYQRVHLRPGLHFYRVRAGDNLDAIAARFGVKVADLRRWNDLHSNLIVAGHTLKIYVR